MQSSARIDNASLLKFGLKMNQHERNLSGFVSYFKSAEENVDSLKMGEAASHVYTLRKFFKFFINNHNQEYDSNPDLFIGESEAKKINDFLIMLENMLHSEGYLYDATTVSKKKLKEVFSENSSRLKDAIEFSSITQAKLRKLVDNLDRDLDNMDKDLGHLR
jgi:hypothetical protein